MPGAVRNIYGMEVSVGAREDSSFAKVIKKVNQRVKEASKEMQIKVGLLTPTKEVQDLSKTIGVAKKELEGLRKKQEQLSKQHIRSDAYKAQQKAIKQVEAELDQLIERQQFMAESPGLRNSSAFAALDKQIEETRAKWQRMQQDLQDIAGVGGTERERDEWFNLAEAIDKAEVELQQYQARYSQIAGKGAGLKISKDYSNLKALGIRLKAVGAAASQQNSKLQGLSMRIKSIGTRANNATFGFRKFAVGIKNDSKKMVQGLAKLGRGFGTVLQRMKGLTKYAGRVTKAFSKMKRGMKMGTGIRGLVRLGIAGSAAYLAIRGLREGFGNLSKYSAEVGGNIGMLKGSLFTLKNALATAFAPIFNAIAPAINALINMITRAATAIAHFTAAFTGKSSVVVAKPYSAAASAAEDAAGATGEANKAAKEYEKTLLGFDQMNILNKPDTGSGSGGSGGGAGGGNNAADMFETVDVDSGAKGLVDRIKEAWAKADFTDLGRDLGNQIAGALNSIPWDNIQNVAGRLGKSIATGFNGLNDSGFWDSIGHTIAQALNTGINFAYELVTNFDFKKFGSAIGNGINKFIKEFEWAKLGKTIGDGIKGAFDAVASFFKTTDFEALGRSLITMLANVDWIGICKSILGAASNIVTGLYNFLSGALNEAVSRLSSWISSGQIWKDLGSLGSAALELTINLAGKVGQFIMDCLKGVAEITAKLLLSLFRNDVETDALKNTGSVATAGGPDGNLNYQGPGAVEVTAKVTKMEDSIPEEQKRISNAIAQAQRFKDAVPASKKWVSNIQARAQRWSDRLKASQKVVGNVQAKAGRFKDAIAAGKKGVSNALATAWRFQDGIPAWKKNVGNGKLTVTEIGFGGNAVTQLQAKFSRRAGGGLYRNGRWQPITAAASGGVFSTGQMFIAREAGPELVGRIGGGTAVMNNDQIVASVSAGVAQAVAATIGSGSQEVNVYLQGDAGTFFKVMQSEARNYTNATGLAPFPV